MIPTQDPDTTAPPAVAAVIRATAVEAGAACPADRLAQRILTDLAQAGYRIAPEPDRTDTRKDT
ncbi:hypothetical protein [Streptomyces celluloflavus]|uniref:hypothetical protein n=1 Tax=Streptomyces celluloflavus TaxID=58344 RepID=UPI0036CF2232